MNHLICFTISWNKKYIDLLKLCIRSLYSQNYTGDILIITSSDFKENILTSISFKRPPLFLISSSNSIGDSSFSKLKIYQYENISSYDKIIYCDCDILWVDNPKIIFDSIDDDKIYIANEAELMTHEYWGGSILNESEKKDIIQHQVLGINAGFFAFNKSSIHLIKRLHDYSIDNYHYMNVCLEQPLFNVFLYRNNCYKILNKKFVAFNEYKKNCALIHFLGGPGDYNSKIEKMTRFIERNHENF
jgi:lipopolysaccharide biosynthesis glycosyltransferase